MRHATKQNIWYAIAALFILALAIIVMFLGSCASGSERSVSNITADEIKHEAEQIRGHAERVDAEADHVHDPHKAIIKAEAGEIINRTVRLSTHSLTVMLMQGEIDHLEKQVAELRAEIDSGAAAFRVWITGIIIAAGGGALAFGIVLAVLGNRMGIVIAIAGLVLFMLGLAMDEYREYLAMAGGLVLLLMIGAAGWMAYRLRWFDRETSSERQIELIEDGDRNAAGALEYLRSGGDRMKAKLVAKGLA